MRRPEDPVPTAGTADRAGTADDVWAHRDALLRVCGSILGNDAAAEDVVSDTIVRALERRDRIEARASLEPWLVTVARRASLRELRRRQRHEPLEACSAEIVAGPVSDEPDHVACAADALARVGRALAEMGPGDRDLLFARVRDELSIAELAVRRGTSEGAVRTRLMRARAALRTLVPDAATWVLAPVLRFGVSLRRRLGRVTARARYLPPAASTPAGAEQIGEVLVAGALALALTLGPAPTAVEARNVLAAAEHLAASVTVLPGGALDPSPARAPAAGNGGAPRAAPSSPGGSPGVPPPPGTGEAGGPGTTTTTGPGTALPAGLDPAGPVPAGPPPAPDPAPDAEAEQPEDAAFEQVVATESGEVFALGQPLGRCKAACSRLFHSPDGGATWERLPAAGLDAFELAVPPAWPADPVLYAVGTAGLQVSHDRGATFAAVPGAGHSGPAAMAPGFSAGDRRILIGDGPGWEHDAANGATRPAPVAPLAGTRHHFAFAPDHAESRVLYAGTMRPDRSGPKRSVVARCVDSVCRDAAVLPGVRKPPSVYAERRPGGVVLAGDDGRLFRSLDGARTFEVVELPTPPETWSSADGGAGTVYVGVAARDPESPRGGLFSSADGGRTWTALGSGTPLDGGVEAVAVLPTGSVIAAPSASRSGGLLCSADGGATWARRCVH